MASVVVMCRLRNKSKREWRHGMVAWHAYRLTWPRQRALFILYCCIPTAEFSGKVLRFGASSSHKTQPYGDRIDQVECVLIR